jgi:hypothetical protein
MTAPSWIRSLFTRKPRPLRKAPARFRPSLEALEDRLAPAATSFSNGILTVDLNNASEAATLSNDGTNIMLTSNLAITGAGASFATASVTKMVVTDAGNNAGQSITFAGTAAYSLSGGLDSSGVETNTFNDAVTATGAASISVTAPQNIVVTANLTGGTGGLSLSANQQATATAGNFVGIDINGGTVQATGSGTLTLLGRGGNDTSGSQFGVYVHGGGVIAGGSAPTTVTGTGNGTIGGHGVYVTGAGSLITSGGGDVSVTGTGSGSISGGDVGVYVSSSGQITSGGMGTVTVAGTGGGNRGGGDNFGVYVVGSGSTITSGGDGAVSVFGNGGRGSFTNHGVYVAGSGKVTSGGVGTVTVTGTGGTGGDQADSDFGVYVTDLGSAITSGGGNVGVTGTGGSSREAHSNSNYGVFVSGSAQITSGGAGTVTVTGTRGANGARTATRTAAFTWTLLPRSRRAGRAP